MPAVANFLNNPVTPLGQAFQNLSKSLMSQPTDAQQVTAADTALLAHRKVQGQSSLADMLSQGFGTPQASASTPAVPVSVPATNAPVPPTATGASAPSPVMQAFSATAPTASPAAPAPQAMDYGKLLSAAVNAGVDPKTLGGYNLFGAANTFGATDQRTQNAQVGDGQSYDATYGALDRKQYPHAGHVARQQRG
jgi:hypothetical protein